jgi:hypothetical protein
MDAMDRFGEALVRAGRRRRLDRLRLRLFSHRVGLTPQPAGSLPRLRVLLVAVALVFVTTAIALAATGLLNGSPVSPEVTLNPIAGNGLPVAGAAHQLALRAADPQGGLPWGMRILPTTRGQVCVQVGRVDDGQLGELGIDSAFGDDGRFHVLPADVLPPGYGGAAGQVECSAAGQTMIFEDAAADRSAVRLLPAEFEHPPVKHPGIPPKPSGVPPTQNLRALSYGLLGPHAVSVTYRTPAGLRTTPVSGPDGAFLIVEPAGSAPSSDTIGGSMTGEANARSVDVILSINPRSAAIVSAVTFRFGGNLCSQGSGSPVRQRCPMRRVTVPRRWFDPTRSLRAAVHLTLLLQSRSECDAAFLRYPCYKGQVAFTAPYAVTSAATDYEIEAIAKCKVGGRPETAWDLERDVKRREAIRTDSLGRFVYTPACAASESFRVRYINQGGPSAHAPHESVVLGEVAMSRATFPDGASVAQSDTRRPLG